MIQQWRGARGFSLLELAMVMLIAGLVAAALWIYLANAREKDLRTKLASQVSQVIARTKNTFANSTDIWTYSGTISSRAAIAGIFPADMAPRNASSIPVHIYGGAAQLDIADGILGTPTGKSFNLQLTGIPVEACIDLLMRFVPNAATRRQAGIIGYLYASQGSTNIVYPGNADVTSGQIIQYCNSAAGGPVNASRTVLSLYFVN